VGHSLVERRCRPFEWLRAVAAAPYPALLESSGPPGPHARWSILCWDPLLKLTSAGRSLCVEDLRAGTRRR
jgi:anthranilate/para-aminobenzoate synthase component I